MKIRTGIITVSDRAAKGEYEDLGGPAIREACLSLGWEVVSESLVPDNIEKIQNSIHAFCSQGCSLILTTGGTGIAPRDVTPEAIRAICSKELPGFGEIMRYESMKITKNSILSRNLAAIVDNSLIIALPGKPTGAVECLGFVAGAIPHALKVIQSIPDNC